MSDGIERLRDRMAGSVTKTTFVVVTIALLAVLVSMIGKIYKIQKEMASLQVEVTKSQQWLQTEVSKVEKVSSQAANWNRRGMAEMREELEKAKREAALPEKHNEALAKVERLRHDLKEAETRQKELDEQVRTQLSDVKLAVNSTGARIDNVSTDVGKVKNDVAETRTNLGKTITDLKRVMGDMGVMSGRVATNARELAFLKELGDRNYTEFTLTRAAGVQSVGDISVILKKADLVHSRYTLEIHADDRRVQKKDRTINEPVQFYVARSQKQPYEIVINEIRKDQVSGYLATPKVAEAMGTR
jgi:DNA repair exonuclease SbcCD ATPase subunit